MNGVIDEADRALLKVRIGRSLSDRNEVTVWIDTAFDGHFVINRATIEKLNLDSLAKTEAKLADGGTVTLQSYVAFTEWFGQPMAVQVVEGEGRLPLLGTALLSGRRLLLDYAAGKLTLD